MPIPPDDFPFFDVLSKQNEIKDLWINQKKTVATLPRRHGKTTIIAELVNQIPKNFSICIVVTSNRTRDVMDDKLTESNLNIAILTMKEYEYPKSECRVYDFLFSDCVDVSSSRVGYNARYLALLDVYDYP
jgi:hypothetical protein